MHSSQVAFFSSTFYSKPSLAYQDFLVWNSTLPFLIETNVHEHFIPWRPMFLLEAEVPVWMITNDCFLNARRFIIVVTGISRLVADLEWTGGKTIMRRISDAGDQTYK